MTAIENRPGRPILAGLLPVLLPLALLLASGFAGLDFGHHWDESRQIEAVARSIETGILLPGFYSYPSVSYWLTLAANAPTVLPAILRTASAPAEAHEVARRLLADPAALLRTRGAFLLVSSLAVLWLHLALLLAGRKPLEALLASSLLATSWQVSFHLRWIAPDGLLMQAGALVLVLSIVAARRPSGRAALLAGGAAAGLAAGCKYPGALLLLPLLLLAFDTPAGGGPDGEAPEGRTLASRLSLPLVLLGIFGLAYLATTPGTLLEPGWFATQVGGEIRHYRTGHWGNTISPGPIHFARMGRFLGTRLFSADPPVAACWGLLAIVGAVFAIRREPRRVSIALLLFPSIYLLYMGLQRVMIVRNLLVVAPFIALLAARGGSELLRILPGRISRLAGAGALAALLTVGAVDLVDAARSIRKGDHGRAISELMELIEGLPTDSFRFSPRVAEAMAPLAPPGGWANVSISPDARYLVFWTGEVPDRLDWPANDPALFEAVLGPREVDLVSYPGWAGEERIVVVEASKGGLLGLGNRGAAAGSPPR
jgi:hypothetical protein